MADEELNWSSLSPNAFEELSADLLRREGFVNVEVMSGPGGKDLGRDIHAEELFTLKTGETRMERILVQCKNRATKRTISQQEAAWYTERAKTLGYSRLLVITSADLSSSAKLYLENCNKSSQGIHISYWNQNKLADLLTKHKEVLAKHVIDPFKRLLEQQDTAKRSKPFFIFPLLAVAGHSPIDTLFRDLAIEDTSISSLPKSKVISIGKIMHTVRPLLDRTGLWSFVDPIYLPGLILLDETASTLGKRPPGIDFAVLTVNAYTGIDPEIVSCINALKKDLTPFCIALVIPKGSTAESHGLFSERIEDLKLEFVEHKELEKVGIAEQVDEMINRVCDPLKRLGFHVSAFYDVRDFTDTVTIVPIFQSKSRPGLSELLLILVGFLTGYLAKDLFAEP